MPTRAVVHPENLRAAFRLLSFRLVFDLVALLFRPLGFGARERSQGHGLEAVSEEVFDFVVVGAGSNTLTSAAYLAASGASVLVLERKSFIGGGCVTP